MMLLSCSRVRLLLENGLSPDHTPYAIRPLSPIFHTYMDPNHHIFISKLPVYVEFGGSSYMLPQFTQLVQYPSSSLLPRLIRHSLEQQLQFILILPFHSPIIAKSSSRNYRLTRLEQLVLQAKSLSTTIFVLRFGGHGNRKAPLINN